jgi:hypothetical protein
MMHHSKGSKLLNKSKSWGDVSIMAMRSARISRRLLRWNFFVVKRFRTHSGRGVREGGNEGLPLRLDGDFFGGWRGLVEPVEAKGPIPELMPAFIDEGPEGVREPEELSVLAFVFEAGVDLGLRVFGPTEVGYFDVEVGGLEVAEAG